MHYAVPRIFHDAGMLHRLHTDICAVKGWPKLLRWVPDQYLAGGVKRLADRHPIGVPTSKIATYEAFGLRYALRRMRGVSAADAARTAIWAGRRFAENVIHSGLDGASGVYTFNVHGLELLRAARGAGLLSIVEQTIAPQEVERKLIAEEHERFPDWEQAPEKNPYAEQIIERERAEWEEASVVLCGSEFVRNSIDECGGPVEKCKVVPYGVDTSSFSTTAVNVGGISSRPIRVLTVGSVELRKGSPYVLKAAELLGRKAKVRVVGGISVSDYAVKQLNKAVDLRGHVPRSEVSSHYEWADVFVLPSLCEGSATVTYEATAHGLPVICTPNTGSIVRDGQDGFIVPIRDAEAIAEKILQLADNKDLYEQMSISARNRAVTSGGVKAYGHRLVGALDSASASHTNSHTK
jgi:glycosyltransferase involved in cell wall biosynthesis